MRTLTMNEVQDVNGAGWQDFLLGVASSAAWDGIKAANEWLSNVGNSSGDSPFQYGA
jgi:hypothetical protein